ncbi:hypothetical protein [Natrialba swarupiae]|uniref:Uncharacterized protein n=1 Tax=Natrialba swarupiae TaxID=2448032 RepID=A0A5D5AI06_9EURY|nr:hypothetical protein [Natrialba swarupiae]TYT61488.1 hypothetical protein FYC77_13300 [Natrialba swarupiae]
MDRRSLLVETAVVLPVVGALAGCLDDEGTGNDARDDEPGVDEPENAETVPETASDDEPVDTVDTESEETSDGSTSADDSANEYDLEPPDPETATIDLLPDTDEWPLQETNDVSVAYLEANEGTEGRYLAGDDDYSFHVLRHDDPSTAEYTANSTYGNYQMSFGFGVFTFAMLGSDGETAHDLLIASPGLDREVVEGEVPLASAPP